MKLMIGLMSGTSMDGIDAALVDVSENRLVAGLTKPYSSSLQNQLLNLNTDNPISVSTLYQLNTRIGREFASAVLDLLNTASVDKSDVIAIGSHGQTISHDAMAEIPYTVQLGCAHTIAETTSLTVVADFRTRDLVLGGKGAPYAPLYHAVLFQNQINIPMAIVNIGGISNVSYLFADRDVSGYDIGPGNCLLDAWAQLHINKKYDQNGLWAASGKVIDSLLKKLLSDPYFFIALPKSISKEYFSLTWLKSYLQGFENPADVQATLVAFTANSIAAAIKNIQPSIKQVVICGGGAHNVTLMREIQTKLPNILLDSSSKFGVDPDYLEAMMFAWLADKALSRTPVDLRNITGAKKPSILGAVYSV